MKSKQTSDRKLMDRLRGNEGFGRLLGIVSTTFEMQVEFFETDFLPTLLGLGAWDDRNWSSRIALERHLAELETATLFQDTRPYRGRPRSMRIETVPVHLPGMSILHSKVLLAVYENGVRLNIGSANLTEQGYRKNLETVAVLTASKTDPTQSRLIRDALPDLKKYLSPWLTPSSRQLVDQAIAKLDEFDTKVDSNNDWIVWSGIDDPLWKKFLDKWPTGQAVEQITIVSPFWSEEKSNDGPITHFLTELQNQQQLEHDASITLMTNGLKAGDSYQPKIPDSICSIDFDKLNVAASAYSIDPNVPSDEVDATGDFEFLRDLHAKIVVLENQEHSLAYFGSANFTRHGWGFLPRNRRPNIETGVVVLTSPGVTKALIPKTIGAAVSLNKNAKGKLAPPDSEPDGPSWPSFVKSVLLIPSTKEEGSLALEITVDPELIEGDWVVGIDSESAFQKLEFPDSKNGVHVVELSEEQLRQIIRSQEVTVKWWDSGAGRRFPVNVSIDARPTLPISPASGNPKEQHLIAYYQGRIRWEDLFPDPAPDPDDSNPNPLDEIDESGVDTSKIQSYIVREFVEALKGINDDLKSAALSTKGCMRLAILGTVSPLALAKHVCDAAVKGQRTPTATGFQLVEILSCLHAARHYQSSDQFRSNWQSLIDETTAEVSQLLKKLKKQFPDELSPEFHNFASQIVSHHKQEVTTS